MSKEKEKYKSVFNISVVGLSGSETFKGSSGVGKSCLCNRFVRPLADDYYPEHTSALSQSDFAGRVVSNDHFLYWGEAIKTDDNGLEYKFNVVEQTEFIDDQSYQPHRSSSNQNYVKRCASVKLTSAEKLMYICIDQLGIESDFEQKPMPEGKLTIDGFLLCFDVSHVTNRTIDDQVKFIQNCYHYLSKTKKPIVLVLTKCDERVEPYAKEAEKFASSPGGKKGWIPIVETSAEENINVELAFMVLAQMIDKARSKTKNVSYEDASKVRQDILGQASEDLKKLLSEVVKSYHENWGTARKNLEDKPAYKRYVELLGKNFASKIFRKHVNRLRDEYRMSMQNDYLRYLSRAFRMILPDLSLLGATWQDTISIMTKQPTFNSWFIQLEGSATPWYENDHVNSLEDRRIPLELLRTVDAENAYLNHRRELELKQHRHDMKLAFKETLLKSPQVTPGCEWGDVVRYFRQYDFISELTEAEVSTIYEQFQADITTKAKLDFQELLYEKAEVFVGATHMGIHDALGIDKRYVAMDRLLKDRDDILNRHISSMLYPNQDEWGHRCLERLVSQIKKTKPRDKPLPSSKWQLKPDSKTLNVVLLGADGLSRELANEITVQSSEDAYTLDGCIHSLRLRCIDGDVRSPRNSFKTSEFSPHGCIAVYSSLESLQYVQKSLEQTVMQPSDGSLLISPPFQGLPVSILLASQAGSNQEVTKLRSEGENLAAVLGCPFIDVMEPEYAYNRRFHESQIRRAMRSLINGIKERAGSSRNSRTVIEICEDNIDPDIRIVACTMADDRTGADIALLPLLNHSSCKIMPPNEDDKDKDASSTASDDREDAIEVGDSLVVETYLGNQRRRIHITMTSYQSARHLLNRRQTVHGFLLLFDTGRPASFSVMKVFAEYTVSAYPIQIVCMSSKSKDSFSSSFFRDQETQKIVIEANKLADKLQARFMTVSPNHNKQTEVYTTFFKDAWEHKDQTEAINSIARAVAEGGNSTEMDDDCGLELAMDLSKSTNADENSHSRPITPDKSFNVNGVPATSSTESLPMLRPSVLNMDRSVSSPASDVSLPVPMPRNTPVSPATESESSWIVPGDYRPETPNTSPTAGLLDNEEGPAVNNFTTDNKPSSTSSSQSSGSMPGKLNPDLVNKVASVIQGKPRSKSQQLFHQKSFTEGVTDFNPPYMVFDPKKTGQRVLPQLDLPTGQKNDTKDSGHQSIQSAASPHSLSKFFHSKHGASTSALSSVITRRPTPYKQSKKTPLKGADDSGDSSTNGNHRSNRYSTAGILESKLDVEHHNAGMRRGTSHELLHPGMAGYREFTSAYTPKEEKLMKQKAKDEEKKRKDEEKRREKDQQKRLKEKAPKNGIHGKQTIGAIAIGNNHTVSEYFNHGLDDIIQGLDHMTPLFVEKCVRYIEQFGISTEGLYRIPANAKERENILRKFDEDNTIELSSMSVTVQTIAGCLTWFFSHKNLPEPLIPHNLHEELEEAINMPDPSLRNLSVRGVIRKLPKSHYATFKYICKHLNTVCQHESENKMNSENISICWWPTLFRPELDDMKSVSFGRPCLKDVLLTCIVQCGFIFYNKPEV